MFCGVCAALLGFFAIGFLQPSGADQVAGHPVQLFTVNKVNEFIFHKEIFTEMLGDKITDHKIMVVSIVGAFKEGKSFLMNFFLKYLEFTYNKSSKNSKSTWMGDESTPLRGFDWKLSQNPTTAGVQTWSKPFCTTINGEKVAILLLDTQGLFDGRTPFEVNTKIFALTSIISSLQIYNIKDKIQEDKLSLLKFVTDYGAVAAKHSDPNNAPFQKLLFLIQNWANSHENPYGFEGGEKYLDNFLKTTNEQSEEIRIIRQEIKSCYSKIACFLNPSPGDKVIKDPKFNGKLSDIDEEYKDALQDLIPALLAPENILLKKMNGQAVTVSKYLEYVDRYVNIMNSNEIPRPQNFYQANSEMSYRTAFEAAIQDYMENMETHPYHSTPYADPVTLSTISSECYAHAIEHFMNHQKLKNQELETSFLEKLRNKLDQLQGKYKAQNERNKEIEQNRKKSEEKNRKLEEEKKKWELEEQKEKETKFGLLTFLAGVAISAVNPTVGVPMVAASAGYLWKDSSSYFKKDYED